MLNFSFRILLILFLLLVLPFQVGCFFKKGDKDKIEAKVFDIYGTVETISKEKLVIVSKKGKMEFSLVDSSIKGSDFGPGALVHVYYKVKGDVNEITMVVEKLQG